MLSEEKLREVALTPREYEVIVERLGREPNAVELGMLGVLWSEHCSYKTSKPLLKLLPSHGPQVLQGPGENAGAVEVGEGWAVVFKVESHNHPSAVEPYQGAATGVGGILRDVIAMGARPVALLDSLRFGPLETSRHHFEGVVEGVAGYGNCMGVPTVGGEIYFEDCYQGNPLVNAMCVGLVRKEGLMRARAEGLGNRLLLVGAPTGKDGIHGAAFASLDLDKDLEARRPAVQVGNPFLEKCLLEACMDLAQSEGVVAIQDLGAAGLTSSLAEAAAKAGSGARVDVALVPRREEGMTAYDVMLSESQERMLVVVEPGHEEEVRQVFAAWDLEAADIGEVTADGLLRVMQEEEELASLPVALLVDGAPLRTPEARPQKPPPPIPELAPTEAGEALTRLLGSPNLCSRRPVFTRYDHMVGDATVLPPGGDASVIRVKGTSFGLALTLDGNGRHCRLDPRQGGRLAVAEAARNLVATGARPLAATDCLNFANPDAPEVYWQLSEAVRGIADACRALSIPIVSGNVSLYNESDRSGPIDPTPVVGMVGLLPDYRRRLGVGWREAGDFALLVGSGSPSLAGSEYLKVLHGLAVGEEPEVDLKGELQTQQFMLAAHRAGLLRSAHDVAEGGLAVAVAEASLLSGLGVKGPELRPPPGLDEASLLFGEGGCRFVVSAASRTMPALQSLARRHGVELEMLGMVDGDRVQFGTQLDVSLERLRGPWERGLERDLPGPPENG